MQSVTAWYEYLYRAVPCSGVVCTRVTLLTSQSFICCFVLHSGQAVAQAAESLRTLRPSLVHVSVICHFLPVSLCVSVFARNIHTPQSIRYFLFQSQTSSDALFLHAIKVVETTLITYTFCSEYMKGDGLCYCSGCQCQSHLTMSMLYTVAVFML